MKKRTLDIIAKAVRAISVPPVMISLLIISLMLHNGVFRGVGDIILSLVFLAILPIISYPVCFAVPRLRCQGRKAERNLAFVFTAVGYLSAFIYGVLSGCTDGLKTVFSGYLISVFVLMILNFILHIRASGHACSISGALVYSVYFLGQCYVLLGVIAYLLIMWASLRLKRHTLREYISGTAVCIFSFIFSVLVY